MIPPADENPFAPPEADLTDGSAGLFCPWTGRLARLDPGWRMSGCGRFPGGEAFQPDRFHGPDLYAALGGPPGRVREQAARPSTAANLLIAHAA